MLDRRILLVLGALAGLGTPLVLGAQSPAAIPTQAGTPAPATLHSVLFKRFVSSIPFGEKLGVQEFSLFCNNAHDITWNEPLQKIIQAKFLTGVRKELENAHIPSPKKNDSVFDTDAKPESADLELGVMLNKMSLDLCTIGANSKGTVKLEAKFALLNPKSQKQVAEFETTGAFTMPTRDMAWANIVERGVSDMVVKLVADPAFKAALASPLDEVQRGASAYAFPAVQPPREGTVKSATLLRSAVVTVETLKGSGTGFYISKDGYLLTNNHVVGEESFVKVKTATGRELPGEVLAFDAKRDVALIKTAKIPFEAFSIRSTDPSQGEEVYAIGSPLGDDFNGSMTHGVVSGFRDTENGRFIQSDVSILSGNSGSPLLDQKGAVVGIAVIGGGMRGGNMNFFIPIAEALEKLSIKIQ